MSCFRGIVALSLLLCLAVKLVNAKGWFWSGRQEDYRDSRMFDPQIQQIVRQIRGNTDEISYHASASYNASYNAAKAVAGGEQYYCSPAVKNQDCVGKFHWWMVFDKPIVIQDISFRSGKYKENGIYKFWGCPRKFEKNTCENSVELAIGTPEQLSKFGAFYNNVAFKTYGLSSVECPEYKSTGDRYWSIGNFKFDTDMISYHASASYNASYNAAKAVAGGEQYYCSPGVKNQDCVGKFHWWMVFVKPIVIKEISFRSGKYKENGIYKFWGCPGKFEKNTCENSVELATGTPEQLSKFGAFDNNDAFKTYGLSSVKCPEYKSTGDRYWSIGNFKFGGNEKNPEAMAAELDDTMERVFNTVEKNKESFQVLKTKLEEIEGKTKNDG